MEKKEKSIFNWIMENVINIDGLFYTGRYIKDLVIMFLVINFMIDFYLNKLTYLGLTFQTFYFLAILLIPIYYAIKNLEEAGVI